MENVSKRGFIQYDEQIYHLHKSNEAKKLQQFLKNYFPNLKNLARIECYDVSNLNFKEATASMVVMQNGIINKNEYRRFKIKNLKSTSDFEMLGETIKRRFSNKWPSPNLLIVDGGRPQVKIIKKTLSELNINIPIIGIAKHPDRLILGDNFFTKIYLKGNDNNLSSLRLIQLIRDESHRFARKYHLFLRSKSLIV